MARRGRSSGARRRGGDRGSCRGSGARRRRRSGATWSALLGFTLREQHGCDVAGLGGLREIDLGFQFLLSRGGFLVALARQQFADAFGFVAFDGTGVRLLFSDAYLGQGIEDLLVRDLELSCQIIDTNFTHA